MSERSTMECVNRLVRRELREKAAYHVEPASDLIKLDAMENPYRWPDVILDEWANLLKHVEINRYPDAAAESLVAEIRRSFHIPQSLAILLGNGSDELIQMLAMTVLNPGAKIMAPDPSFVMYRAVADMLQMSFLAVPLANDFSLDTELFLREVRTHQPELIFLSYPNNPTGNLFDREAIRDIITASEGLVVIDEAYFSFAGNHTMLDLLNEYSNVLLMRTLSKMGLAGLRLGVLVGAKEWIEQVDKTRLPYNVNSLTQVSAQFALENQVILNHQIEQILKDRQTLLDGMQKISGIEVFHSDTNFLLFRVVNKDADDVFVQLKNKGLLIKNLNGSHPMLENCLRVTVGKTEEIRAFIVALRVCMA